MSEGYERGAFSRVKRSLLEHYRIIHSHPLGRIGFWVVTVFVIVAVFAPWLAPHDPWVMQYDSEGNFASLRTPSWAYPVGTTHLGYDLFSQLILATRTTLLIGAVSGFISILIGANVGLVAGYYGGKIDAIMSFLANLVLAFPV